jgi:hypothetical protein
MWYALIKGDNPEKGVTVDTAGFPEDLDFSRLKHCSTWSVWIFWDTGVKQQVALINWGGGSVYLFRDVNTDECCNIKQHAHILPMVRGALVYNYLFHRFYPVLVGPTN